MKNPAAVTLGRLGGQATSEAKAATARANGAKGGRPKKPKRVDRRSNQCITMHPNVRQMADEIIASGWADTLSGLVSNLVLNETPATPYTVPVQPRGRPGKRK